MCPRKEQIDDAEFSLESSADFGAELVPPEALEIARLHIPLCILNSLGCLVSFEIVRIPERKSIVLSSIDIGIGTDGTPELERKYVAFAGCKMKEAREVNPGST